MTTITIKESGMEFGSFDKSIIFHIEQCNCYSNIKQNVQMAEFLLLRESQTTTNPSTIWIIEAKSSSPKPEKANFQSFIYEIRDKLLNALSLFIALLLKRHGDDIYKELPESFKSIDIANIKFKFTLIINGHHDSWLPPINSALLESLRPIVKTWKLDSIPVITLNGAQAQRLGLVSNCE